MNPPNGLAKPATPDDPYDDNDSDLDLDLNELDPVPSAAPILSRGQSSAARQSYDYGGQIPMRNLRFGGRRRPREEDEDMEALLDDTDGTTYKGSFDTQTKTVTAIIPTVNGGAAVSAAFNVTIN